MPELVCQSVPPKSSPSTLFLQQHHHCILGFSPSKTEMQRKLCFFLHSTMCMCGARPFYCLSAMIWVCKTSYERSSSPAVHLSSLQFQQPNRWEKNYHPVTILWLWWRKHVRTCPLKLLDGLFFKLCSGCSGV